MIVFPFLILAFSCIPFPDQNILRFILSQTIFINSLIEWISVFTMSSSYYFDSKHEY